MRKGYLLYVIIFVGIAMVTYASWEIAQSKVKANDSLAEARQIVGASEDKRDERFLPEQGQAVGILSIPKIEADLAIIEGTDPDELEKGVGHYNGSYYPDENGQIVLSGHRDTVFTRAGELEIGDELIVEVPYGEYRYRIVDMKIVDANDRSVITLQNDVEELIVTTCYPFGFIGNAPNRYIIYAERF